MSKSRQPVTLGVALKRLVAQERKRGNTSLPDPPIVSDEEIAAGNRGDASGDPVGPDRDLEALVDQRMAAKREREAEQEHLLGDYWSTLESHTREISDIERLDGFPPCGVCKSRRVLGRDVPVDHPEFGTTIPCPACKDAKPAGDPAFLDALRAALVAEYCFSDQQRAQRFSTFVYRSGTELALEAALRWAAKPDGWLVIHGTPEIDNGVGCGKTHLLLSVANALIDDLQRFRWYYGADLVRAAKRAMVQENTKSGGGGVDEFQRRLERVGILMIDDLGTIRADSAFAVLELLEPALDYRYRERLPTLITCIGDPDSVKRTFSESIGRRMQDRRVSTVARITAGQFDADDIDVPEPAF